MVKKMDLQLFAQEAPQEAAEGLEDAEDTQGQEVEKDAQEGKQGRKYTDSDVDRIIDRKFAEWQKKQQKAVDEAKKLAQMDAAQKAAYERDQLQKELEDYKRRESLAQMTKTARGMLAAQHISVDDALLETLVTPDAEKTKAAVERDRVKHGMRTK